MTIIYCTIAALVVYYLALWGWYRHADNKTENSASNGTLPEKVKRFQKKSFQATP